MSSLIEQLQKLEEQKKALIGGVLQEIKEKIDLLNATGFNYRLVEGPEAGTKRGGEGKKRITSEQAFLGKMRAASFRKWGKTAEAKTTLQRLAQDNSAPSGVRGRANALLGRMGG